MLRDQADANAYDLTGRTTVLKLGQTPGDAEEEFMEYKIHLYLKPVARFKMFQESKTKELLTIGFPT